MNQTANLKNQFLIAMPSLDDPNFEHSVTYICDHNNSGAMGITVNRPLEIDFAALISHLEIEDERMQGETIPIYQGGPVDTERGFVIHEGIGDWEATIPVTDNIAVTMSQDIIEAIAGDVGPRRFLIALGYAGWGAGQIEEELLTSAWLNGPANIDIVFNSPADHRWTESTQTLGVDLSHLSSDIGHA